MSGSPNRESSIIQVPDSSPTSAAQSSPPRAAVPPSRLSSLKDRFAFKPQGSAMKPMGHLKQDIQLLKKRYPYISGEKIIEIFNASNRNLRETSAKLSILPKPAATAPTAGAQKHVIGNTDFLNRFPQVSPIKDTKVTLQKPSSSIASRYLNKDKFQTKLDFKIATGPQKKRKLMRGTDLEDENSFVYDGEELDILEEKSKKIKNSAKKQQISDEEEELLEEDNFDDSDDGDDDLIFVEQSGFDDRVLSFLNTAEKRDIIDIASVTPGVADALIKKRPFRSLYEIQENDFSDDATSQGKNSRKKLIGEKIVDKTSVTLKGYDAVSSLIKKCSKYGDLISSEINKWGVGIDGKAGELELVEVDVDDEDNSVEEIKEVHHNKIVNATEKKAHSDDDDDDDDDDEEDGDYSDNSDQLNYISKKSKISHQNNTKNYFKKKPSLLSPDLELKNYQQVGINWLNLLYQNNFSCILADEMGLGKTCQVIAFLAHLKELKYNGPHLVVVPSSTLENWLREFEKFCPSFVVMPYYGSQAERAEQRYDLEDTTNYDVLITTYNLATGNKDDQRFLRSRQFNVVVYDEGHMLKNSTSDRYTKLMKLTANFRLLLTGTPLQNNLRELISLLAFILPDLFNEKKADLVTLFDQKVTTKNDVETAENYNPLLSEQSISKAKTMMTPFVLRRKKDQVLKHLPAKKHFTEMCKLLPEQHEIYSQFVEKARKIKEAREALKAGVKPADAKAVAEGSTNILMQLRKASLHPLLFRQHYSDDKLRNMSKDIMKESEYVEANVQYIFEDMQVMSDFELDRLCLKFPKSLSGYLLSDEDYMVSGKIEKLKELLEAITSRKERVLVFSLFTQVLDVLERVLSIMNLSFIRLDGQTSVNERQQIIDTFYNDDTIPVFLLSTKAGGFGINLVCANNVVLFDSSFNPHDDKQAEDRCHRVGQTKEVNVFKLITEKSIEENIAQMGESKLQLDQKVSEEEALLSLI